jgi:hypothetical protein
MMFSDLRFFFADDKIFFKLSIFHELDIFSNEHQRIKESYFERLLKKQREGHKKKKHLKESNSSDSDNESKGNPIGNHHHAVKSSSRSSYFDKVWSDRDQLEIDSKNRLHSKE